MLKRIVLLVAVLSVSALSAGEPEKAGDKVVFDPKIDGWAYGQVWGLNTDLGLLSINGQLSKDAIEFAKRIESTLKDGPGHDPARFTELQAKMEKMEKRQIHFNYDKAAPTALLQCPVKGSVNTVSKKVLLTDLKIGDTILVGFSAESGVQPVHSVVLVENVAPTTPPTPNQNSQK